MMALFGKKEPGKDPMESFKKTFEAQMELERACDNWIRENVDEFLGMFDRATPFARMWMRMERGKRHIIFNVGCALASLLGLLLYSIVGSGWLLLLLFPYWAVMYLCVRRSEYRLRQGFLYTDFLSVTMVRVVFANSVGKKSG